MAPVALLVLLSLLVSAPLLSAPASLKDCAECPELVIVPAGEFTMGSDDGEPGRPEGPKRKVVIPQAFALGRTEVTVAQFRRFIKETGYEVGAGCRAQVMAVSGERSTFAISAERSWLNPGFSAEVLEDHPVVCVSHADAVRYVEWLGQKTGQPYRLPSESEWEYAARAGGQGIYFWGSNADLACSHANVYDRAGRGLYDFGWGHVDCDDGFAELAPVASFAPNGFGLHDMLGNVWEWTADCYQLTYDGAPNDGSAVTADGECARWSVRGGGWMTRPSRQRITFRGRDPVDARYSYFGFRVARDVSLAQERPATP